MIDTRPVRAGLVATTLLLAGCAGAKPAGEPAGPSAPARFATPAALGDVPRAGDPHWTENREAQLKVLRPLVADPTADYAEAYMETDPAKISFSKGTPVIHVRAVAGTVADPHGTVERLIAAMPFPAMSDVRPLDDAPGGVAVRCGAATENLSDSHRSDPRETLTVCFWADSGSVGLYMHRVPGGADRRADFLAHYASVRPAG
ncbi:hypothetical protein [Jidongwangia harbinensis]|uniref:hypothetical protein n=1 Tax=Jidongwangia harbinensis TaxID=2878561 RepID=UPI001CD96CCF|nr:hypothetical protein [Jidongwangia harbinensis]MCA2212585.1 hypothetical protein [Jidongwangia harbinensis]